MKIFGRKGKQSEEQKQKELTVEDLITLERYEEAEERLKARIKAVPKDLYAHLKLAEVYVALKNVNKALDEYAFVADSHADDGFFDKGIALLGKASKLAPGDDTLPRRIEKYKRMKIQEQRRRLAIEGLKENKSARDGSTAGDEALEVEMLWNKISKSHLVDKLDGEMLKKLFSVMEMIHTRDNQLLAEMGSQVPAMYLVVAGVVEAGAEIGGRYMDIRSFSTGDVIGESALLERKAWPANYKVKEAGTIFRLNRDGLEQTMIGNKDPRGFISVLREQNNDRDVAVSLQRLRSG